MPYCGNCGASTETGEKFCRVCGNPVDQPSEDAETWHLPPETQSSQIQPPDPGRPTLPVAQQPTSSPPGQTAGAPYSPPLTYYEPGGSLAYRPPPISRKAPISLSDWLVTGWHVYRENWLLMSLGSLLAGFLTVVTFGFLGGPLLMGLYRMAFKAIRSERPEIGDLFAWEGRFLQAFLAFLICGAIYVGAAGVGPDRSVSAIISLLISPLLTVILGLTMPLLLERKIDVAAAINEVGRLIFSRDVFMWWLVGIVFATIIWGGILGCGVGLFITLPWIVSASAVAYSSIFGLDDPNRTLP